MNNMKKQAGFVLNDLIIVIWFVICGLLSLATFGAVIWVAWHFISKWW